ncbi:MAG: hypothetical protein GY749_11420 [Desulfobacteraceae bacterium]|nr:hypothetical protein [Desulfobacteraceae bacterium]
MKMISTEINYNFHQYNSLMQICIVFINGFDYNPGQIRKTDKEDVAAKSFSSVESHVHAVYCAYILMHDNPPGVSGDSKTILEKQQDIKKVIENKKTASALQELTQIGGAERFKNKLKSVLTGSEPHNALI